MPYHDSNAAVSATDVQTIRDAFRAIKEKLPLLVNLADDERKAASKTGPERVTFVQNALIAAEVTPEIFPDGFSTPGFQRDVDLFAALTELGSLAAAVASQIDAARLALGGESMRQATQVYNCVREAAKTTPGLRPLADHLGEQFQRASNSKARAKSQALD